MAWHHVDDETKRIVEAFVANSPRYEFFRPIADKVWLHVLEEGDDRDVNILRKAISNCALPGYKASA